MAKRIFHPIGFCPKDGVFPVKAIALSGNADLTISNCTTNCPVCNGNSEIVPGRYESTVDRLNVLIDESISSQALGQIRDLAEAARRGAITAAEAKRAAEKIHPKAGRLFDVANWSDQAKATLFAAIIASVTAIAVAKIASTPSQSIIIQPVVERAVSKRDLLSTSSLSPSTGIPLPKPRPKKRH